MPASGNPFPSDHHGDDMVELQRHHGGTTAYSAPDDACPVIAPQEMPHPPLTTGVELPHPPTCPWVARMRSRTLEPIAQPAGEPSVVLGIGAAFGNADDVVKLQYPKHILLWILALSTAVLGPLSSLAPDDL